MGEERRRFPRATHPFDAQCRTLEDVGYGWVSVTVVNLSASGLRFRSETPFERGAEVEVQFKPDGFQERLVLRGRIVWVEMRAAGVVEHGAEMSNISPAQELAIDRLVSFLRQGR